METLDRKIPNPFEVARPVFEYANGYLNGNKRASAFLSSKVGSGRSTELLDPIGSQHVNRVKLMTQPDPAFPASKDDTKSDFVSGGGGRSNSRERHKANRRSCDLSSAVEQVVMGVIRISETRVNWPILGDKESIKSLGKDSIQSYE